MSKKLNEIKRDRPTFLDMDTHLVDYYMDEAYAAGRDETVDWIKRFAHSSYVDTDVIEAVKTEPTLQP